MAKTLTGVRVHGNNAIAKNEVGDATIITVTNLPGSRHYNNGNFRAEGHHIGKEVMISLTSGGGHTLHTGTEVTSEVLKELITKHVPGEHIDVGIALVLDKASIGNKHIPFSNCISHAESKISIVRIDGMNNHMLGEETIATEDSLSIFAPIDNIALPDDCNEEATTIRDP